LENIPKDARENTAPSISMPRKNQPVGKQNFSSYLQTRIRTQQLTDSNNPSPSFPYFRIGRQ